MLKKGEKNLEQDKVNPIEEKLKEQEQLAKETETVQEQADREHKSLEQVQEEEDQFYTKLLDDTIGENGETVTVAEEIWNR